MREHSLAMCSRFSDIHSFIHSNIRWIQLKLMDCCLELKSDFFSLLGHTPIKKNNLIFVSFNVFKRVNDKP